MEIVIATILAFGLGAITGAIGLFAISCRSWRKIEENLNVTGPLIRKRD